MSYIEGFVLPIHPDNYDAYKTLAEDFAREARKHGGVSVEAIGDGLRQGEVTSFPRSVQAKEGENVIFSFVVWPDKAARDAGWEKIMATSELHPEGEPPFDGKRMFFGGFTPLVGNEALDHLLATTGSEIRKGEAA